MTKRMLIDTTHPEETRVAVVSGTKLEEYDYETMIRKQLKSNIYLVKVTRVEPSLQAAFVDFGGNRHGFLPFPEIHPDYYRIPIADREALIAEERAIAAAQAAKEDAEDAAELAKLGESIDDFDTSVDLDAGDDDIIEESGNTVEEVAIESYVPETFEASEVDAEAETDADETEKPAFMAEAISLDQLIDDNEEESSEEQSSADAEEDVDNIGGDSVDAPIFRSAIKRKYKIQEVIKRNQIMLIQISKEERGNKGAAVTSYISLPGRYCVLMPNSPRGGGVSRKVSNAKDRQRLKKILHDLNVPEGMSVILRTAGVARSAAEIKRDLDYLLRLWDQIRELTLKSTAPALIYEEGNLIKRAIRDLYRRDINEVHVAGEEGFKIAYDFMRTLMPSHAERVIPYNDDTMPLFSRYQVEKQIDEIHNPTVHLRSGGYIVINPTEAMVSIDVNSGKATKGRHIEETALKTNLEAADEVARQLRLRDQGGLVVIDFIDMEDKRNNRIVEKRLRDAMQGDRARIQLGRISPFGLLELSRQRLNPSLVETNFETCKHCNGTGMTRTVETSAVIVLRAIEDEGIRGKAAEIKVSVATDIALYIFNHKRDMLAAIEKRQNIKVYLNADDSLIKPAFTIETIRASGTQKDNRPQRNAPVQTVDMSDLPDLTGDDITDDSTYADQEYGEARGESRSESRGERNNGRNNGRNGNREPRAAEGEGEDRGGRRRGRRGGRRRNGRNRDENGADIAQQQQPSDSGLELFVAQKPQHEGAEFDAHDQGEGFAANENAGEGQTADGQPPRERRERRNRRRGGRDRFRRGERGDRQNNNEAGAPAAENASETPKAPRERVSREIPIASADSASQEKKAAPSQVTEFTPTETSDGKGRKGWWKRLTE